MTTTIKARQRRKQRHRAVAYVAIAAGWAAAIWISTLLAAPPWLHTIALFVHLASLIVGFGAVLMVDWYALLWVTEWRTVRDLRQVDVTLKLPIWVGIIGLLASGALLQPDLGSPLTIIKLGAVLVLSLNGVAITRWTMHLARFPRKTRFSAVPRPARIRFISSAVISQIAWWAAVVIGMLNSTT
ncbi:hypothetical protein [Agromyces humatus]|uniref:Copper resistance protein D domain-containing protein n=1 Tax=Agromyces humatus TaxID=279573 RepID=A0ABN2KQH0_9MICO|nr:hypothetical protein [Agromyces humatus]